MQNTTRKGCIIIFFWDNYELEISISREGVARVNYHTMEVESDNLIRKMNELTCRTDMSYISICSFYQSTHRCKFYLNPLSDTSKTRRSGRQFVNKSLLLSYSTATDWTDSEWCSQSQNAIRNRTRGIWCILTCHTKIQCPTRSMQRTLVRLGEISSNMQSFIYVLISCIFYAMVLKRFLCPCVNTESAKLISHRLTKTLI